MNYFFWRFGLLMQVNFYLITGKYWRSWVRRLTLESLNKCNTRLKEKPHKKAFLSEWTPSPAASTDSGQAQYCCEEALFIFPWLWQLPQFGHVTRDESFLFGPWPTLHLCLSPSSFHIGLKFFGMDKCNWWVKLGGSAGFALTVLQTSLIKVRCGTDI